MGDLNIEYIDINKLIPYINNPRINDNAVDKVAASIKEFGFKNPIIVDGENVIVAGHTRLLASRKLGLDTIPIVRVEDLSDKQIKAFRIADNKTSEFAEWDLELLEIELEDLEDIFTGFDDKELENLFKDDGEVIEDNYEVEVPDEPKSKLGDIYQLGRHRLMCGDSTSEEDVNVLMNSNRADMVFTDPPYNIDYMGVNDKRQIKNDKMSDEDFTEFISKAIGVNETMYICCSWQYMHLFKKAMEINGVPPKAMIIWDKVNPAQHLDKYFKQHEIILYYGKFGGEKTIRGDIWEVKRQRNTVHPTMKPIELISMALEDNPEAKVVKDVFGGSGSTLMACEQLNRDCYMMELDPKYIDVIIDRWETFTGEKAVLINE